MVFCVQVRKRLDLTQIKFSDPDQVQYMMLRDVAL